MTLVTMAVLYVGFLLPISWLGVYVLEREQPDWHANMRYAERWMLGATR